MSFQIVKVIRFPGGVKYGPGDEQTLEEVLTSDMKKRFVNTGAIVLPSKKKSMKLEADEGEEVELPVKKGKKGRQAE